MHKRTFSSERGSIRPDGLTHATVVKEYHIFPPGCQAFTELSRTEGIVPALEPCHALAYTKKLAKDIGRDSVIVVTLSGRGDKDVEVVAKKGGKEHELD